MGPKFLLTAKRLSYHLELNNSRGASMIHSENLRPSLRQARTEVCLGAKHSGLLEGLVKDYANGRRQVETANTRIFYWNCEASLPIRVQNLFG